MSDYNNEEKVEVTAEQQIENEQVAEELNTIWNVAMQQLKPKLENDQKFKDIEIALESKKKWLLDNAAIIEINRKIDAAKKTKNKAKIRISKLEKRKTNISKKTNNEIVTSLEIAEIIGKEHKTILRDIRNEIKQLGDEKAENNFVLGYYKDEFLKRSSL